MRDSRSTMHGDSSFDFVERAALPIKNQKELARIENNTCKLATNIPYSRISYEQRIANSDSRILNCFVPAATRISRFDICVHAPRPRISVIQPRGHTHTTRPRFRTMDHREHGHLAFINTLKLAKTRSRVAAQHGAVCYLFVSTDYRVVVTDVGKYTTESNT